MDDVMSLRDETNLHDTLSLDDAVANAAAVLRAGGAAVFPTDTVYGLGVAVGSCASPQQLFAIKRRDEGKPVAWLVGGVHDLDAYGKAIKGARTELDWLSTNPMVVDAYIADPACGFRFSAGAYIALTGLLVDLSKKSNINRIPKELPLYLIAGSEDPVGDRGRGVTRVFKEYKEAGIKDVDMRLYLGARHEILNEVDKEKVYADVLKWLEAHLA